MERISISSDKETREQFEELSDQLKKTKSQTFREFVKFFYKYKDSLSNGITIDLKLPGEDQIE